MRNRSFGAATTLPPAGDGEDILSITRVREADKADERNIDALIERPDESLAPIDPRLPEQTRYPDPPDVRKAPRAVRLLLIIGSSAALWGLIYLAIRAL